MLNINLVPQNIKDELKLKTISDSLNTIIFISLFFVLLFASSAYGAIFYLEKHFVIKDNATKSIDKDTESYTNELMAINKMTDYTATIQADYIEWSDFFYSLGLLVNGDLSFNSINIDKKTDTVTINAHAKTRDGLLAFKEKIEKNELLSNVSFPLKTLFEKENIDFSINATISSYDFNKH